MTTRFLNEHGRRRLQRVGQYVVSYGFTAIWLIPFIGLVATSVSPFREVIRGWWNVDLSNLSLENYFGAWNHTSAPISDGVVNSLIVTFPATIVPIVLGSMAAYGFLRYRFPARNTLFFIMVLLLAIPQYTIAVPLFQMLSDMNLINTFLGLIIMHSAWGAPWVILFMRGYFSTLPKEVEESAQIDGAGPLSVFFKVVVPMSWPGMASVFALQFTWVWNDFFFALITIYDHDMMLATQRIPLMRGEFQVDWGVLTAAAILTTIVPLVVYMTLQKYYVKGFIGFASK